MKQVMLSARNLYLTRKMRHPVLKTKCRILFLCAGGCPMEAVLYPSPFCSAVLQRTTIRFWPPLVQVNSVRGSSEGRASPSVLCR